MGTSLSRWGLWVGVIGLISTLESESHAFQDAGAVADPVVVADVIRLNDGSEVHGHIWGEDQPRATAVTLWVHRDWARQHVPERLADWERTELKRVERARGERLQRLEGWRAERSRGRGGVAGSEIDAWIGRQITKLRDDGAGSESPLISARILRREIAEIVASDVPRRRLLRQGWRLGVPEVESFAPEDLIGSLRARNVAVDGSDPAPIDDLLPIQSESDRAWLLRRAATEIRSEPEDLRWIAFQGMLMRESGGREAQAAAMLGQVQDLTRRLLNDPLGADLNLGGGGGDQLQETLRGIANRGRSGALVTELTIAPDATQVRVRITLWIRDGRRGWQVSGTRDAMVDPSTMPMDQAQGLAQDPQVQAALRMVETLGLGQAAEAQMDRALRAGVATQCALAIARERAEADLDRLVLPVDAIDP